MPLWDDYQHLFSTGKQHIILFDDANKSISNLNYLLSKIGALQSYSVKVIVTSRDYVKKQVYVTLDNYSYQEFNIPEFKDEEIGKIIVAALPILQYHSNIKRKIVDLAKGNARVALMATYSVTPDSETNYLSSPILLYEKYFKKISEEIDIFNNPIILKSIAIVSFFGFLDRNNEEFKTILSNKFNIEWNELWTAIMQLHNSEILDVYSNEIVKVSDQVLATYAFYKCFIDDKSAVINYAEWIATFIKKFSNRIRVTLIDLNNTFISLHIRDLVLPHLNEVIKAIKSDEELYAFYNLFWFYKGRDCLLYLKNWIKNLPQEEFPETLKFSYVHNDHTYATKHFELLKSFWNYPNELFKPSLELTFALLTKQPSRLSEILKFIHEDFKYKLEDREGRYLRQNMLLDILLDDVQNPFANGIFLNLGEALLGWHYREFGPAKGHAFTIYDFDLDKSNELMKLRERILTQLYNLFESENEQVQNALHQIIYPGGNMDKSIYVDELPIYQKLISEKFDIKQYAHCNFVSTLAQKLIETGTIYPEKWDKYIQSDIIKLSKFLGVEREDRKRKLLQEFAKERKQEYIDFVSTNDWQSLEKFLLDVYNLYKQQKDIKKVWLIESAVKEIYIFIARKNKVDFANALRLLFSGKICFPLEKVIHIALLENIMTGKELLDLMNDYEFDRKYLWHSLLLTALPEDQVDETFFELLINNFKNTNGDVYINRMLDYIKYDTLFDSYKKNTSEFKNHNIITYITSIILMKYPKSICYLGPTFCVDCAPYFTKQIQLLKDAFWINHEVAPECDYEGKELKTILEIDNRFLSESLKKDRIEVGYSSKIRLENINSNVMWDFENHEELVEDLFLTILKSSLIVEEDIYSLFTIKTDDEKIVEKMKCLITKLTQKHSNKEKVLLMLIEVVYHNFYNWFIEYFREFLLINKDINLTKKINFERIDSLTGSRIPLILEKIEFYRDIIKMINALPNILDYSTHIDYFEEEMKSKKNEIKQEQRRDFM